MKKTLIILMIISLFIITACDKRKTEHDTGIHDNFILLQGGSFIMGSIDGDGTEQPIHQVSLSAFAISKYEVSQKEWVQIFDDNPSAFNLNSNMPVEQVSWYNALIYCNKLSVKKGLTPCYSLSGDTNTDNWGPIPESDYDSAWDQVACNWAASGYRLPTEAEWEYAARGANLSTNTIYSGSNNLEDVAWFDTNSNNQTQIIGLKQGNPIALYDMSGNVWEWCWDEYSTYTTDPQIDPHGGSGSYDRVIRGGSWSSSTNFCRVFKRNYLFPGSISNTVGLRLVRTVHVSTNSD